MKDLTLKEYEQFSAYLDGQLTPAEAGRLEEQLKNNPDWRLALDELNATRAVLRRAPHYRAPRNFTISPEVARQYARKSWIPSFVSFRLSTAVAALSVILVLLLQLLPAGGLTAQVAMAPAADLQRNSAQAAPTQEALKALETAPQAAAPAAEAPGAEATAVEAPAAGALAPTPPPMILWGAGGSQATGLGGGGGGGADSSMENNNGIVGYNQEHIGSPMYSGGAGAADSAISPSAAGGIVTYGGVASPDQPTSANNYTPPYSLPPQSAETLPEQPAQPLAQPGAETQLKGSGPILGLPSADTAGQIVSEEPITPAGAAARSFNLPGEAESVQPAASFWTTTRIAQAGLLGLALLAGVFAILARRKNP